MRTLVLMITLAFSAGTFAADAPRTTSLGWIAGCWGFERAGSAYREHWMPATGNIVAGISQRTADGFSQELEYLRIVTSGPGFDYLRETLDGKQIRYGLTHSDTNSAKFQGFDASVFPAIISYEYIAPDILNERLEGRSGGKRTLVTFPMRRIACDAPIQTPGPTQP